MKKEDTLHRIKETEEQVRQAKELALQEKEKIVRTARREALELRDSLAADAERVHEAVLRDAATATERDRERLLSEGRQRAAVLKAEGESNQEPAVKLLIEKFKGAVHA